jgi:Flp pilus assembly pilin Flp
MSDTDTDTAPATFDWLRCEEGQALVEYALILSLISIVAIGLTPVGQWVATQLGAIAAAL